MGSVERKMTNELSAAPALSTPAEHLFESFKPESSRAATGAQAHRRSDHELRSIYEISRTARELRAGKRRRIALQFPDSMLGDAPWVVEVLSSELEILRNGDASEHAGDARRGSDGALEQASETAFNGTSPLTGTTEQQERIYVLADTSYSSCCVDEIAAEHAAADVVVHYGRSCLSPTSRLPVIYVFTKHHLNVDAALEAFEQNFPNKQTKVALVADVTYQDHVSTLATRIRDRGYIHLLSTAIFHNPLGRIPNRLILDADGLDVSADVDLKQFSVFHISTPPTALLLALSSRVNSLHVLPTSPMPDSTAAPETSYTAHTATRLLGRRYARLLSLATAGVIGILVNTLSVANYLTSIDSIREQIASAGKKSYTVVVGKLNPAKLANFAEVDGWVVVGCWESSLVEDDAAFFRPVITPFELSVALTGDESRVWGGDWWGGIEAVKAPADLKDEEAVKLAESGEGREEVGADDDEDEPPEFDLRTGKLVSRSRPMRATPRKARAGVEAGEQSGGARSGALALRPKSELATVNGVVSPGAEFLRSQRTWQGLGSDFDVSEASTAVEEGRSGVARGYTVGQDAGRR